MSEHDTLLKRVCCPAMILDQDGDAVAWNVFAAAEDGSLRTDLLDNVASAKRVPLADGEELVLFVGTQEDGGRKFLHDLNNALSGILQSAELLERFLSAERLGSVLEDHGAVQRLSEFFKEKRVTQLIANIKVSCRRILDLTASFREGARFARAQPVSKAKTAAAGKVLMIEDDPAVGEAIRLLLADRGGLEVELVASGEQAVEAMNQTRFDAVVLDWHVPGTPTGEALLDRIVQELDEVAVVVLTGDETVFSKLESDSRVAAAVQKPITRFDEFLQLVAGLAKGGKYGQG